MTTTGPGRIEARVAGLARAGGDFTLAGCGLLLLLAGSVVRRLRPTAEEEFARSQAAYEAGGPGPRRPLPVPRLGGVAPGRATAVVVQLEEEEVLDRTARPQHPDRAGGVVWRITRDTLRACRTSRSAI